MIDWSGKRVLVTGGAGFVGSHLVDSLAADGARVTIFDNLSTGFLELATRNPAVQFVGGDLLDTDALGRAGLMDERWSASRVGVILSSRVKPAKLLGEAIVHAATKPSVFLSASAVGIYGMRKDDVICTESTPPGDGVLANACVDWEKAAHGAREAGVRVAHPRIGIVFGDGGALPQLIAPYKAFVGGPVGDGRQWTSWVHWKDVVRAIEFAAENTAINGPFNMTAPHPVTMNELAKTIGEVLHRPSALRVPAFALKAALGADRAEVLLTGQRVVPKVLEEAGFTFEFPELRAALENLVGKSG